MISPAEAIRKVQGWNEVANINLGILLTNAYIGNEVSLKADAGDLERIIKTAPSALVAPEVSDDLGMPSKSADIGIEMGLASAAYLTARQTGAKPVEIGVIALAAQAGSNVVDSAVMHARLLDKAEANQLDVGASAAECALGAFGALYWIDKIKNPYLRRGVRLGGVALGVAGTVAVSFLDRKNFTTDLSSHLTGIATGAIAYVRSVRSNKASTEAYQILAEAA